MSCQVLDSNHSNPGLKSHKNKTKSAGARGAATADCQNKICSAATDECCNAATDDCYSALLQTTVRTKHGTSQAKTGLDRHEPYSQCCHAVPGEGRHWIETSLGCKLPVALDTNERFSDILTAHAMKCTTAPTAVFMLLHIGNGARFDSARSGDDTQEASISRSFR